MQHLTTNQIYEHLFAVIKSQNFLQKKGLGNEVPFFICPFGAAQQVEMDRIRKQLVSNLRNNGVVVLDIDLYDLAIDILKGRGLWERITTTESSLEKSDLKDLLRNVLDPEKHLVPKIAERMAQKSHHVMFLSGVGETYPYIRSHTILNNLQSTAKNQPTVLFFPGTYAHSAETGASLDLFDRLRDDKYYRAFNILEYI